MYELSPCAYIFVEEFRKVTNIFFMWVDFVIISGHRQIFSHFYVKKKQNTKLSHVAKLRSEIFNYIIRHLTGFFH